MAHVDRSRDIKGDRLRVTAWLTPGSSREIIDAYNADNDPGCGFAAFVSATLMIGACEAICDEVHTLGNFPGAGQIEDEWRTGDSQPILSNQSYTPDEIVHAIDVAFCGRVDRGANDVADFMQAEVSRLLNEVAETTGDMELVTKLGHAIDLAVKAERRVVNRER